MRRKVLWAAAFAVSVTGVVLVPQTASATPFPETWLGDNSTHTYCETAGFPTSPESLADYSMAVLDDTTDLTVVDHGTCADPVTDIWWVAEDILEPGVRGFAQCMQFKTAERCERNEIHIDFAEIDQPPGTPLLDRRKTGVHEVGHTVGLGHHADHLTVHRDAMMSGDIPDSGENWRRYGAHDIEHLNANY